MPYNRGMTITTYDDITGDGAKHKLTDLLNVGGVSQAAQKNWDTKWFQVIMTTAAGTSRLGDVNVSATNGITLGQFFPPIPFATDKYLLDQVYVILALNDVASVARVC